MNQSKTASIVSATGVLILLTLMSVSSKAGTCNETSPQNIASQTDLPAANQKSVYWGDLHVHTAYSLDAYSFGTLNTPADAYAFARGAALETADGNTVQLDRPLDFTAVTDHAEWFDFMYLCTDPGMEDHPDCNNLRDNASPLEGLQLFIKYVNPSITDTEPRALDRCKGDAAACKSAYISQWQRIQDQANEANDPCNFTAFIGYEWSATKNYRHTHRNVIFATDEVPAEAFDYIRYPELDQLFQLLDENCKPEDNCDVITIPHNTNMGDGTTFDVEQSTDRELARRNRFERLIEVHQEKGNSECLSPLGAIDEGDCDFEIRLSKQTRPKQISDFNSAEWEHMRGSYVRGLLKRGLAGYKRSGDNKTNPLQLGVIGSTDGHAATPGFVDDAKWHGPVFGLGNLDRAMSRMDWNPGGLVAIRAEENTRASLFAAMQRREVYATSGPRIVLNFESAAEPLSCEPGRDPEIVAMGGDFSQGTPNFRLSVSQDKLPLAQIEIIKGTITDGIFNETVESIWQGEAASKCLSWTDETFNEGEPAFWYARIKQVPTPRWSAYLCRQANRCDEFPGADSLTQERAWSSAIWYLP